jgi:hypothetical protein
MSECIEDNSVALSYAATCFGAFPCLEFRVHVCGVSWGLGKNKALRHEDHEKECMGHCDDAREFEQLCKRVCDGDGLEKLG